MVHTTHSAPDAAFGAEEMHAHQPVRPGRTLPRLDFLAGMSGMINSAIVWIIALTAFLVPFTYANWTVEYLRYNKLTLIVISTVLVVVLWAIRILLEREIRVKKTVMDLPILLLLGAGTLAMVMSQIPGQSFWGAFPNFEDAYILTASLIILYYALVNHLRGGRDWLLIIGMVLASSVILAVITLLQYWSVYLLPFNDISNNRLFSPFGTVFQVGFYLAVLMPIASGFFVGSMGNRRWFLSALVSALMLASLIVFGIIDYWPVWTIAAFGILVSMLVSLTIIEPRHRNLAFIPLVLFIVALVIFKVPSIRDSLPGFDLKPQQPITLSLGSSMSVAREAMSENWFQGVGQGNYGYAYKHFRPLDFNAQADWLLNYNRPANQLFLVLTTMGVVGLAAALFFIGKLIFLVVKAMLGYSMQKDADPAVVGLFVALASYVLVCFFSWETIGLQMLFWTLLVLAVFIGFEPDVSGIVGEKVFSLKLATDGGSNQRDFLSIGIAAAAIVGALFIGYKTVAIYAVDTDLRQAINAGNNGDTNGSLLAQNKVVTAREVQDYHLRGVAILLHNQGVQAEISQDNEDQQRQDIERKRAFFREATRFARQASDLRVGVSENHEVLLGIYSTLADYGINKIDQVPMSNLMEDIRTNLAVLTPTEVTWRVRMANYYVKQNENEEALSLLGQANVLKSNLVDIHYLAAKAFGGAKDYENAIVEANVALRSLEADHPWTTELNDLVKEWTEAQKTGATTTTPAATTTDTSSTLNQTDTAL